MVIGIPGTDGRTLTFFDAADNIHASVTVADAEEFEEIDAETFPVRVDIAGTVLTDELRVPGVPALTIRDEAGAVVDTQFDTHAASYPPGWYALELSMPLKLFVIVESAFRIRVADDRLHITLEEEQKLTFGVRSPFEHPRATVVTTGNVTDICAAVSTFSSALRTVDPERSYPSMRGHPPLIEFGEELTIPDEAVPPKTAVDLHIPASYLHTAVAAPLAYYLGATLSPGQPAGLVVDEERLVEFGTGKMFEEECASVLMRVLFLDCLTRTTVGYDIESWERDRLEAEIDVDWADLYHRSYADRLRGYLELPTGPIDRAMPDWGQSAYVVPNVRTIQTLPFLAHDLVSVRGHRTVRGGSSVATDGGPRLAIEDGSPASMRSPMRRVPDDQLAIDRPIGLDTVYPASYLNRLDRDGPGAELSIAVVCTDDQMTAELESASSVYDSRESFPARVERHEGVSVECFENILARDIDFLHYIGHIDADGFECADGTIQASDLDEVGVELFFLNACVSVTQASDLVDAGAVGGIVTHDPVSNRGAVRLGEAMSEFLIHGMPMRVAMEFAREHSAVGHHYSVVGDPKLDLTRTESGIPYHCEITQASAGEFELTIQSYLTFSTHHGSVAAFRLDGETPYYLTPTRQQFTVSREVLLEFLELEVVPVRLEDQFYWSPECIETLIS